MTSTDFDVEAIDRLCFVCGCDYNEKWAPYFNCIEGSHESNF